MQELNLKRPGCLDGWTSENKQAQRVLVGTNLLLCLANQLGDAYVENSDKSEKAFGPCWLSFNTAVAGT